LNEKATVWDHLDARAVLTALRVEVEGLLRPHGLRCLRAVPRIDGSLYLELEPGPIRLEWCGPLDEPARPGLVAPAGAEALLPLLGPLSARLGGLLARPEFSLLAFRNQALPRLVLDDSVVRTLLGDCLVPGRTLWFDYALEWMHQDAPASFRLGFRSHHTGIAFEVRQAGAAGPGELVLQGPLFELALLEDGRGQAQRGLLPHQVERFVGFLLSRSTHAGMRLERSAAPGRAGGPTGGHGGEPVSVTRWGNPLQWRQFFADFEVERSGLCGVQFTDPVAFVLHGEAECIGVEPEPFTPLVGFANLPWPRPQPGRSGRGSRSFFTGLVEEDAILGGVGKLERALAAALGVPGVRCVQLNNTCLPKIIGDDARSAIRRLGGPGKPPILDLNTDLEGPERTYQDLVRQALEAARRGRPEGSAPEAGWLNLVGFPPGPSRAELAAELGFAGLEVNAWLLPELGLGAIGRYLGGRAGLIYPHAPWLRLAEQVLAACEVPLQCGPAPFGPRGTRAWMEAALRAVGAGPERLERWENQRLPAVEERWRALRSEASRHVLGFVVSPDEWPRLWRPELQYGVPLAELLLDMGFSLQVLVLGARADRAALAGELGDRSALLERVALEPFEDRPQLVARLRASPAAAFYSEVAFDTRLTRVGKAQFHLGFIEPGLEGGLRSVERLLGLCRWPFYRRYARYLEAVQPG